MQMWSLTEIFFYNLFNICLLSKLNRNMLTVPVGKLKVNTWCNFSFNFEKASTGKDANS